MNRQEVLQLIQQHFRTNYLSGAPAVPPHHHNYIDNVAISYNDLTDVPTTVASSAISQFEGTGSDGALSISSGTTTINLGNAPVFTLNYTSISITGTGALAFSNPYSGGSIVIIKSQGNVTITSSATNAISVVGIGAATLTSGVVFIGANPTAGGTAPNTGSAPGGTAGAASTVAFNTTSFIPPNIPLIVGAGSGAGSNGSGTTQGLGGIGVNGGGALLIQCGGALNITGTLNASGMAGGSGTLGSSASGGGGGGGGGGSIVILYNTLIANSGTYTVAGGAGGTSPTGSGGNGGSGGGGGGSLTAGTAGTSHSSGATGSPGGAGGNGFSLIAQNTYFV